MTKGKSCEGEDVKSDVVSACFHFKHPNLLDSKYFKSLVDSVSFRTANLSRMEGRKRVRNHFKSKNEIGNERGWIRIKMDEE